MKHLCLAASACLVAAPAFGLTSHAVPIVTTLTSNGMSYAVETFNFTLPQHFENAVVTIDTADILGGAATAQVNGRTLFAIADNAPGRGYFQFLAGGPILPASFQEGGVIDTAYSGVPFQVGANVLRLILNSNPFGFNPGGAPPVPGNATLRWSGSIGYATHDPVPEPAVWATLLAGLCLVGVSARRRRGVAA